MTTTATTKQFKVGKSYSMRSACNYECVWTYKVLKRTACTVTLKDDNGKTTTCRISKGLTAWCNAECVKPLGTYSMSPILKAE